MFVKHSVWQKSKNEAAGTNTAPRKLWAQLETRMNEMLERRRRLIKYTLKKERESIFGSEISNQATRESNEN
jgi:hypothetical protein